MCVFVSMFVSLFVCLLVCLCVYYACVCVLASVLFVFVFAFVFGTILLFFSSAEFPIVLYIDRTTYSMTFSHSKTENVIEYIAFKPATAYTLAHYWLISWLINCG